MPEDVYKRQTYNNGAPLHVLKGINLNIEQGEHRPGRPGLSGRMLSRPSTHISVTPLPSKDVYKRQTQKNATEPAFHNEYWNEHRPGIYVEMCIRDRWK